MSIFVFPPVSLSVSSGPVAFIKDGVNTSVTYDTVTPTNSEALPVNIVTVNGQGISTTVDLSGAQINVQLTDRGTSPDAVRIGDGTNLAQLSVDGEIYVNDMDGNAALTSINSKLTNGTQVTQISDGVDALSINADGSINATVNTITGYATSAKQDALLAELQLKADLTETQPVSIQNASVAVTGTFWQATQPVSGSVSVSNLPATQAVSGSVSVSNFPASQAVTGTFWQATQPVSIAATVATSEAALSAKYIESSSITTTATAVISSLTVKKIYIQAPDTNTANIRVKISTTAAAATTTSGWQFQPGRSDSFDIGGGSLDCTVSVCAESGTQGVTIQYA